MQFTINAQGQIEALYSDETLPIAKELGTVTLARASYVEPTADAQWTADLEPVNGPVLGPFPTRKKALEEEVEWLEKNHFNL